MLGSGLNWANERNVLATSFMGARHGANGSKATAPNKRGMVPDFVVAWLGRKVLVYG